MVYEDLLLPTETWISVPFEWAFLLFHVVVTLFIGLQLIPGTKAFASAFFLFFFLLSLADIGNYWTIQYMQRVARYGLLGVWRPSSIGCTLTVFFTGFFSYLQFATHLTIAANRYTVFQQPAMHRRVNGYVAVSFALVTCALSCLLELRTFFAFRKMNTSHRREHRDDYKLLSEYIRLQNTP
ncbi:hypothetical protein AAVH_23421 [Aphelenchoides avenae]|nr:hypothetical protein AAVH_23421 [Aphelenchus avenae]